MKSITPRQLNDQIAQGGKCRLIDVRTPAEHAEVHVPGVCLVPLDRLDAERLCAEQGVGKGERVVLLCRSGGRATQAARQLEKAGFADCVVVEGGTQAWAEAGLPVNRGTRTVMSLERQVRIAAGSLVLTGLLLAHFVHPGFVWLSAFVGGGLVFAGITDWCGMGLLLARAPWNQRGID